jgi:hypothetical protein
MGKRRKTTKAQRTALLDEVRNNNIQQSNSQNFEPKPKFIGNGMRRIERQQREPYSYKGITGMKYIPKNMIDRNYKCVISKVVNDNHGKPEFEHLCFNWVVEY